MAPGAARKRKSAAGLEATPSAKKGVKKEQGSSEKLPRTSSAAGGAAAALLQKVDEIHESGLNVYEWLEKQILDWPGGPAGWAASLDEAFPPQETQYCLEATLMESEEKSAVVHARLAQFALHPQSGSAGMIEAPVARAMIGSIASEGFCTDATSIQGAEMMAGKPPNPRLTDACAWQSPYAVRGKSVAPLFSIHHVKGWKRAVAAAAVATLAMQKDTGPLELPPHVTVSLATVHVLLKRPTSLRDAIETGRRITLTSAVTRLRPNCFNHMHQLMLLRLEGGGDCQMEVELWNKKNIMEAPAPNAKATETNLQHMLNSLKNTKIMASLWEVIRHGLPPARSPHPGQVFQIGHAEAQAAKNLVENVTPFMVDVLRRLVTTYGFSGKGAPLTHAALASDFICLKKGPTCKTQSWTAALKNSEQSLELLAKRIDNDWRKAPKVLRKPLTVESLAFKQKVSATFHWAMQILKTVVPEATYQAESIALQQKFCEGLLDEDLAEASEREQEPWTLKDVEDFRNVLNREEAKKAHLMRRAAHEHTLKAARASLDMLLHDLDTDAATLDKWVAEVEMASKAADRAICDYRSDRYKRGCKRSEDFMHKRMRFVDVPSAKHISREISLARRLAEQWQPTGSLGGGAPGGSLSAVVPQSRSTWCSTWI